MRAVEVVHNPVAGWDLRVTGEKLARSNYRSRSRAICAAERTVEVGEADSVVVRNRTGKPADTEVGFSAALWAFALMLLGVIALVAAISLTLSLTGFTA